MTHLRSERDWEAIHEFEFTGKTLLGLTGLMKETHFRNYGVRVAKVLLDVEKKKSTRRFEPTL